MMWLLRYNVFLFTFIVIGNVECSKKKGLSTTYPYICSDTYAFNHASWWYDWTADQYYHKTYYHCTNTARGEYVPMIWGEKHINDRMFQGSRYVLGFNEPDRPDQSNLSPERVAALWPQVEKRATGKILVGPALSGCDDANHCINWFDRFFASCKNCRVDILAGHAYNCDPYQMVNAFKKISLRFNKKMWLTEFACARANTAQEQIDFLQKVIPLLEASPYIERYAWFVTRLYKNSTFINTSINLLEPKSSQLTKLGKYYDEFHI